MPCALCLLTALTASCWPDDAASIIFQASFAVVNMDLMMANPAVTPRDDGTQKSIQDSKPLLRIL